MIQVFRISTAPESPWLRLSDPLVYGENFLVFDGRSKTSSSTPKDFDVLADSYDSAYQFYNFAPGVLTIPADVFSECSDMLYATDGTERISLIADNLLFSAINPLDPFPALRNASTPFPEGFFAPIFRIKDQNPLDLFCISGAALPMDEFKSVYDHFNFKGLVFEEVWRSETS